MLKSRWSLSPFLSNDHYLGSCPHYFLPGQSSQPLWYLCFLQAYPNAIQSDFPIMKTQPCHFWVKNQSFSDASELLGESPKSKHMLAAYFSNLVFCHHSPNWSFQTFLISYTYQLKKRKKRACTPNKCTFILIIYTNILIKHIF